MLKFSIDPKINSSEFLLFFQRYTQNLTLALIPHAFIAQNRDKFDKYIENYKIENEMDINFYDKSLLRKTVSFILNSFSADDFFHSIYEILLCREVDSLKYYLSRMLFHVFTQRPETLKSSETMKYSEILVYNKIDELRLHIAERKIEALSYLGFANLIKYLSDELGMPITLSDDDLRRINEYIETRNLIVHNLGIVNRNYMIKTKPSNYKIGDKVQLDKDYLDPAIQNIVSFAHYVDTRFMRHFKMKNSIENTGKGKGRKRKAILPGS